MRFIYTGLLMMITPYFLIRLWWKGRKLPGYRARIGERFGFGLKATKPIDIWVHAVSLGEVIAVTPLIEKLLQKSTYRILMTTMTPTGSEQVVRYFGDKVLHQYVPYDFFAVFKRFLKHYQPKIGVVMETELWPNLILSAKACHVPLVLMNGRLSQRSFSKYRLLSGWFQSLLNRFTAIWVQTEEDRQRFIQLGADAALVSVQGNVKFDLVLPSQKNTALMALKTRWGKTRPVIVLGSTHEDEESQFLALLPTLQAAIPDVLLFIVPRHPERFQAVYALCVSAGYCTGRCSQASTIDASVEVVILDAMGELLGAYACADYAFVGGSLVPVGGHNVLEPIALQIPVFSGQHTHHFKFIMEALQAAHAIQWIDSAKTCVEKIIYLFHHSEEKQRQVKAATAFLKTNQGAAARYMREIESILSK